MINRKFKKCLITGITGSGGSYLAEHIISKSKKIKVFGIYRSKGNKKLYWNKPSPPVPIQTLSLLSSRIHSTVLDEKLYLSFWSNV